MKSPLSRVATVLMAIGVAMMMIGHAAGDNDKPLAPKLTVIPAKGPVVGAWISDGREDVHITTESNGFVIGFNPTYNNLKFTDPALIFEKGSVTLQLKGEDGEAIRRPVPLRIAKKLLHDMLNEAVRLTEPAESRIPKRMPKGEQDVKAGGCNCLTAGEKCTCASCVCDLTPAEKRERAAIPRGDPLRNLTSRELWLLDPWYRDKP